MGAVLHIDCSARVEESVSRRLSRAVVEQLFKSEQGEKLIRRDLGAAAPPPVNSVEAAAFFTPPPARAAEQVRALAASDELTGELLTATTVVIGAPMYNFTVPASLKAWIDYVVRPGKTFRRGRHWRVRGPVRGQASLCVHRQRRRVQGHRHGLPAALPGGDFRFHRHLRPGFFRRGGPGPG